MKSLWCEYCLGWDGWARRATLHDTASGVKIAVVHGKSFCWHIKVGDRYRKQRHASASVREPAGPQNPHTFDKTRMETRLGTRKIDRMSTIRLSFVARVACAVVFGDLVPLASRKAHVACVIVFGGLSCGHASPTPHFALLRR